MLGKVYSISKINPKRFNIFLSFIFLTQLSLYLCGSSCSSGTFLSDSSCFNNIINLNHLNYRAGHFASKKNGDLVVEYSGVHLKKKGYFMD